MYDALSYHRQDQVDFIEKVLILKAHLFQKKIVACRRPAGRVTNLFFSSLHPVDAASLPKPCQVPPPSLKKQLHSATPRNNFTWRFCRVWR